jgi:hypothetical protein
MLTLDSGLWPQKLNVLTLIKTRFARKNYVWRFFWVKKNPSSCVMEGIRWRCYNK